MTLSTLIDPVGRIIPADERAAAALERIATALEQMALDGGVPQISRRPHVQLVEGDGFPTGEPPLPTPPADLPPTSPSATSATVTTSLPPITPAYQFTGPSAFCPVHRVAWKTIPAGVSKRTGAPYQAFLACPERGCNERPQAPR